MLFFAFHRRVLFVESIITFHWVHLNNNTPYENKCFNPRNQNYRVTHKFCLCTDASYDTQCSHALNTQLPRVNAECAIHHGLVIDGQGFGLNQ